MLRFTIFYAFLVVVFVGCYSYQSKADAYEDAIKMKAVIFNKVTLYKSGGYKAGSGYYYEASQYKFEYKGQEYIDVVKYGGTKSKGDSITIIFPSGDPGHAVDYHFFTYWFTASEVVPMLFFFGLLFAVIIFIVFIKDYGKPAAPQP